jgi:hypothetical protein
LQSLDDCGGHGFTFQKLLEGPLGQGFVFCHSLVPKGFHLNGFGLEEGPQFVVGNQRRLAGVEGSGEQGSELSV